MEDRDPSEAASRHELERLVQHALAKLSPNLRAIVVLRYIENLSCDEVARTLQITPGEVKSRLRRVHEGLDRELTAVLDQWDFDRRG